MKRKPKLTTTDATAPKKHHWATGLLVSMEDPELKVKEDDKIVVIKDKYPKAQYHYLILPKADIPSLWHIKKENEDLLFHMAKVADDLIKEHKDSEFFIGYHAVPSMHRLHLHVISTDFNSPCLKTKYHWNSFTTPFFLHSADVCNQLREKGELKRLKSEDSAQHLNTPLKCHKCSTTPKNMPDLKRHLLVHLSDRKERLCLLLSSERHRGPVLREGTGRDTWEQEAEDQQLSGSFSRSILTIVKEKETANRIVRRSSSLCVPFSPASTVRGTPKAVILESHWAQGQCRSVERTTIISSILAVASQTPRSCPRISPDPPPNTLFKSSKGIARRKLGKLFYHYSTTTRKIARFSRGNDNVNKIY